MLHGKRARTEEDDYDDVSSISTLTDESHLERRIGEIIDLEVFTEWPQRKRARLSEQSNTNEDADSVLNISDEEESDVSSDDIDEEVPARRNNAAAEDEESADDDLGDLDDAAATQRVRERYEKNARRENHAADNAIIEELECRNFMCHAHLKIMIGPLINFIIGHNGSGKSAVLTALTVCLGGKATATNRGQSLKQFIKEGTDAASVSVKIKNQGHTAFKPDIYGRSIIVERHFSRGTSSGYRIKNESGKVITTKKAELEEILDAFALQLDNPMNVLTQDMARQFLNSSSAGEKYKFFLRGTHLEDLDRDYRLMAETLSQNGPKLKDIEKDCTELKRLHDQAEEKLKIANRQQTLQDSLNHYSRQMAWAQVAEQEDHLKILDDELRNADMNIQKRQGKADAFESQLENADRKFQQTEREIKDLQEELGPHKANKEQETEKFKTNRDTLLESNTEQRELHEALTTSTNKLKNLQESIEEERRKLANANDGQHAQRLEEIQDAKEAAEQAKIRLEHHKSNYRDTEGAVRRADAHLKSIQPQKAEKEQEVREAQNAFSQLQGGSGDWMSAYHHKLRDLLRLVDRETRFKEKPVGPMGRHVTLLKPEWSLLLEKSFGVVLSSFAVTSRHDQAILSELMKRTEYDGRIFIGSATPIDTSGHEPDPSLLTWMRALKIDNHLVRNQLIVNQGIDQTVLIEDREKAAKFTNPRPQNVRQIFSFRNPGRLDSGVRWAYSSTGAANSSPMEAWRGPARMQANTQDRINLARQRLEALTRELHDTERRIQEATKELTKANQALVRWRRDDKAMKEDAQRLETRVNELQDALEEDTPQTGTLDQLEADHAKEKEERKTLEEQFKLAVEDKNRINAEQRTIKSKIDAIDLQIQELQAKIEKKARHKDRVKAEYDNILMQKNEAHAAVGDAEQHKANLQAERQRQEDTVANFTQQASAFSARVRIDPGETTDSLDAKLKKIEEQIQRAQQEVGGTREDLTICCAQAKHVWKAKMREWETSVYLDRALKKAMDERQRRWKIFRNLISLRASASFTYLLSERQFRGELVFGHGGKTLDIKVCFSVHHLQAFTDTRTGRARHHARLVRRSPNQDALWRRKVLQHHLSSALAVGGHGQPHPVPRRVRRLYGQCESRCQHEDDDPGRT